MKGMGKAMPKDDNLIVPFSSYLIFGTPTLVQSEDVTEIMNDIQNSVKLLEDKIK